MTASENSHAKPAHVAYVVRDYLGEGGSVSYDLVIFDPRDCPLDRSGFISWYEANTADSVKFESVPDKASPPLKALFLEMMQLFPPMNGPYKRGGDVEPELEADYSFSAQMIIISFSWSVADKALSMAVELAAKHVLGVFDISSETSEVWMPRLGEQHLVLQHQS